MRFIKSIIIFIVFAAALGYFANPLGFELRIMQLESQADNFLDSLQTSGNTCPDDLENDMQNNAELLSSKFSYENIKRFSRVSFEGTKLESWNVESSGHYSCSKGENEGEVKQNYYCEPYFGNAAVYKYEETDENGEITETRKIEIEKFGITPESEIESVECVPN